MSDTAISCERCGSLRFRKLDYSDKSLLICLNCGREQAWEPAASPGSSGAAPRDPLTAEDYDKADADEAYAAFVRRQNPEVAAPRDARARDGETPSDGDPIITLLDDWAADERAYAREDYTDYGRSEARVQEFDADRKDSRAKVVAAIAALRAERDRESFLLSDLRTKHEALREAMIAAADESAALRAECAALHQAIDTDGSIAELPEAERRETYRALAVDGAHALDRSGALVAENERLRAECARLTVELATARSVIAAVQAELDDVDTPDAGTICDNIQAVLDSFAARAAAPTPGDGP